MYVASDAPDPAGVCMACLCLEVCAALLSCWGSLFSGPGYPLHFPPTGTYSPVGRLASISSGVPAVFNSGALAPKFLIFPQLASSQLISKRKLLGTCYLSLSLALLIPLVPGFPLLRDKCSPSPIGALPLSLFRDTCYFVGPPALSHLRLTFLFCWSLASGVSGYYVVT